MRREDFSLEKIKDPRGVYVGMRIQKEAGNALMLTLILIAVIGLASASFFANIGATLATGGGLFAKKRAQYAAEGTLMMASKLSQVYLNATRTPTDAELNAVLDDQLPPLVAPEYLIQDRTGASGVDVDIDDEAVVGPIQTGAFKGITAPQTKLRLSYQLRSAADSSHSPAVRLQATMSVAQVTMFQFLYFIDLLFVDFSPARDMFIRGRMHANGDICLSGLSTSAGINGGLQIQQVTSAGRIMAGSDPRCRYVMPGNHVYIASDADLANPVQLQPNNDNGCVNCAGSGSPWGDYALTAWNGNVLDGSHGVSPVRLPTPSAIQAQPGADGNLWYQGRRNNNNLRTLLDPVRTADSDDVAKFKFAYKADIRIISGVWYLRDVTNPRRWPGIPIWSDHPGSAQDAYGNNVGQDDLRAMGRWPVGLLPHRYSYYEYDVTQSSIDNTDREGVISYGNLYLDDVTGPKPTWSPGHWLGTNANRVCRRVVGQGNSVPHGPLRSPGPGFWSAFKASDALVCNSGVNPGVATALLNGTRGGIVDLHAVTLYPDANYAIRIQQSRILPMNFDIAAFQRALSDTTSGELGSYFAPGGLIGSPFNGILWISTEWPGSNNGYNPLDRPTPPPTLSTAQLVTVEDPLQPNNNNFSPGSPAFTQQPLPYTLCSDTRHGQAFDRYEQGGTEGFAFAIPQCSWYGTTLYPPYVPSKVRLINGWALNPARFQQGISIITNVGMHILGEFNTQSDTSSDTATPWIPVMIGADQIIVLSNAWSDANSSWNDWSGTRPRVASATTYNFAALTGWMRSTYGRSLSLFPSMMEDWTGAPINFNGSIVIGFYPVYERYGRYYAPTGSYTYRAGTRNINYDKHYHHISNQPPGVPLFSVSALLDFKAE
ncbi:MAG: hypothetical protein AB7G93_20745 [Bdellovibrionales bacterium]